jgi:hypothetical protein
MFFSGELKVEGLQSRTVSLRALIVTRQLRRQRHSLRLKMIGED